MASVHNAIIRHANELGYFPTVTQAEEIIDASVRLYADRCGGNPWRERIKEQIYWSCMDAAIQRVMERPPAGKRSVTPNCVRKKDV